MDARLDAMMNRSKIVGHGVREESVGDEDDSSGGVIATLRAPAEVLELVRGAREIPVLLREGVEGCRSAEA